MQRSQQRPSSAGALVHTRKKTVWSPKPRWRIKHAWNSSQNLYYSRAIVFSDGAVVKNISPPGWTELVRPPTAAMTPTRLHGFQTAESLSAVWAPDWPVGQTRSLPFFFFLIFFPDAGGAGRRTQTRPDKTFKERSGGRCGVSASRSWLLVANRREWKQEPGCVCVCGSCHPPSVFSDVYDPWCAAPWEMCCAEGGCITNVPVGAAKSRLALKVLK